MKNQKNLLWEKVSFPYAASRVEGYVTKLYKDLNRCMVTTHDSNRVVNINELKLVSDYTS